MTASVFRPCRHSPDGMAPGAWVSRAADRGHKTAMGGSNWYYSRRGSVCIWPEVGKMPLRPDSINATQRETAIVVVAKVPKQNGPTPGSPAHGYASPNPPIREPKSIRLLTGKKQPGHAASLNEQASSPPRPGAPSTGESERKRAGTKPTTTRPKETPPMLPSCAGVSPS